MHQIIVFKKYDLFMEMVGSVFSLEQFIDCIIDKWNLIHWILRPPLSNEFLDAILAKIEEVPDNTVLHITGEVGSLDFYQTAIRYYLD